MKPKKELSGFGDLLFLVLLFPFCMWLGWWGILPALAIGTISNVIESKS